ncbi:GbsR/MarR family transcriptional regulator [Amycolatopsis speibonae]|uniref:Helix-turn-helix domain-containing protein n=1 Tax=Amycolatopsis speibonae TaxID=1450224 RepID=A0ABV7P129_9PSEU
MTAGRLTAEERERIASGLADGLGYAGIARTLGRPTSTVSREVARNGGRRGYRAEHAQHATGWRARRGPKVLPSPLSTPDNRGRDPAAVDAYRDRFAGMMVGSGLPRMAARLLACLVTTDSGGLTARELVQRLQVSPAAISKAVAYLENLEVVTREPLGRRERYLIDDDVWLRAWLASARTNATWAETAHHGAEVLGAETPAGARMARMGRFFSTVTDDMAGRPSATARDDALTVLAVLVKAGPDATGRAASVLGWPRARVEDAVREAAGPERLTREGH